MTHVNAVSFTIVVVLFAVVTLVGFAAARWRHAEDKLHSTVFVVDPGKTVRLITMNPLHLRDWALGGTGFGALVSWFLLGGDIYTAYTFIAVPALVYAVGAAGFYALSFSSLNFLTALVFLPRLWSVARVHGYVTPADFVRGRYGSRGLSLAVTFTGILATMPYLALQLVGIQSVLVVMGVGGSSGNWFMRDLPLLIAFMILAAYTYTAGLRAPAMIALVKDTVVYLTVIVAFFYIPARLGGWGHIFTVASAHLTAISPATGKPSGGLITPPAGEWAFATLALGSALGAFMYPHTVTAAFATSRRDVVRRSMAIMPAYTLMLGMMALFGYLALASPAVNAGVKAHAGNTQLSVPLLFEHMFPSWFAGIGYSAIVIGALVPAAIMSIAAANLFTRNIYREFFRPGASASEETRVSRLASLVVKGGAVVFVLALSKTFSINLFQLGGIWILQTFPSIVAGLYTRWFHHRALLLGWAVAMIYGTIEAYRTPGGGQAHFGASTAPILGHVMYIAIAAFVINVVVSVAATLVFRAAGLPEGTDETTAADYTADPGEAPGAAVPAQAAAGNGSGRHRAHRQPTRPWLWLRSSAPGRGPAGPASRTPGSWSSTAGRRPARRPGRRGPPHDVKFAGPRQHHPQTGADQGAVGLGLARGRLRRSCWQMNNWPQYMKKSYIARPAADGHMMS